MNCGKSIKPRVIALTMKRSVLLICMIALAPIPPSLKAAEISDGPESSSQSAFDKKSFDDILNKAYQACELKNSVDAKLYFEQAVVMYEHYAQKNPSMYWSFCNVRKKLEQCGQMELSHSLLLRIIEARIRCNYPDGDDGGVTVACNGLAKEILRYPLDDLLAVSVSDTLGGNAKTACKSDAELEKIALLESLIDEAKTIGHPSSVIFLLDRKLHSCEEFPDKLKCFEEIEYWKSKENNPSTMFFSMLKTAHYLISENRFDLAVEKVEAAALFACVAKKYVHLRGLRSIIFTLKERGCIEEATRLSACYDRIVAARDARKSARVGFN